MMNTLHKSLTIAFLAVSIFISGLNVDFVGAQNTALEPVTIQPRWFYQFRFAGYYAEEGLDVSLSEFDPKEGRDAPVRYEDGISFADILKWVLIVATGAFGIVLLFLFWNRSLAKQVKKHTGELKRKKESLEAEIGECKKAEDKVRRSEEKFRALVTNTEEIVYMIHKDGTFLLSEGKGLSKLGLKPGQVVGKSVFELYKDYPQMLASIRKAFNGETVTTEENIDGNYFRNWYTPHQNHDGEIIELLGLSVNITEQKQAEQMLQDYQRRLKALASQLTIVEEKERRRIAADLHDHVGQSLALARMQLASARKSASEPKLAGKLDDISDTLLGALEDTRQLMFELSSPLMNEIGLSAAISQWLGEQIGNKYGLRTEFIDNITDAHRKILDLNVRAILYRNVRELLVNVVKHARANKVSVRLEDENSRIKIIVEDDGIGFDPCAAIHAGSKIGGFGLFSIEERMADMGGNLKIVSEPDKGCTAILSAPFGVAVNQERD